MKFSTSLVKFVHSFIRVTSSALLLPCINSWHLGEGLILLMAVHIQYVCIMKRFILLLLPLLLFFLMVHAQDSIQVKRFSVSGFADLYYQFDFNQPLSNERPPFVFNYKRHNKPAVNLAMLKLSYNGNKLKTNIALMTGDYARYNLAAEPNWLQYVYEANIAYSITPKLSVEAGVLPSHIGMETAISRDCWNLSRSLLADNSPYYETGVKLNYTFNKKWTAAFLVLQGWQNIKDANRSKAIGTQLLFKPNDKWLINSSSFVGNELPDSVAAVVRVFHNLYITHALSKKMNIAFLLDAGVQGNQSWWGTSAMLQYHLHKQVRAAVRAEYYNDKNGVIVTAYKPLPFAATGFSFNVDYLPFNFVTVRAEVKYLNASQTLFTRINMPVQNNLSALGSLAFGF